MPHIKLELVLLFLAVAGIISFLVLYKRRIKKTGESKVLSITELVLLLVTVVIILLLVLAYSLSLISFEADAVLTG